VPGKNAVEAEEKLGAFARISSPFKRLDPGLIVRAANSSVFIDFPHRRFDMSCLGNVLYGIGPAASRPAALQSPWSFRARIIAVREVRKGASVGYASEYLAPRRMRVATIPVGYADGLTMERLIGLGRTFRYWASLGGERLPFVGRCGISHVLVDVTDAPKAVVGSIVGLPVRRTAARAPRVYR
jgi:alanine racemase